MSDMENFLGFCSNPSCGYQTKYERMYDPVPPEKFCTICGSPMISRCSSCDKIFTESVKTFCQNCGTRIKQTNE